MQNKGRRTMRVSPSKVAPGIFKSLKVTKGSRMPEGSNYTTFLNLFTDNGAIAKLVRNESTRTTNKILKCASNTYGWPDKPTEPTTDDPGVPLSPF